MMQLTSLLALASALLAAGASSPLAARQASGPTVDLGYATYQGAFNVTGNFTSFLGVRYAAPPTGENRWRAPVTPNVTTDVLPATTQPNECPQAGDGTKNVTPFRNSSTATLSKRAVVQDEDCLFLNVFSPGQLNATANLPVVVWIHGGGYMAGAASSFRGDDLVRESGFAAVAVLIQYRLGVFGFLPGNEVNNDGVLNAGLLDQRFALQWVQDHIAQFGGDPTKVTIWGESAGAGSVLQHIVADGGQTNPPLFRAAMSSSSFLPFQYQFNDTIPEELFAMVASQTGCAGNADIISCLRAAPFATLQAANAVIGQNDFFGVFVFVPVVDGTFIVERPTQTLARGAHNGEVLLAVTNALEGSIFVNQNTTNITDYVTQLFPLFGPAQIQAAVQVYQNAGLPRPVDQANAIMGENIFICPTYFMLRAFNDTSFKGEFAVPPATHGEDVNFYFPDDGTPAFNNADFITAFSTSFLSIVRFLDTNDKIVPDIKPDWPKFAEGNTEMLFNRSAAGQPVVQTITTDPGLLDRCNFWLNVSSITNQ